VCKGWIYSNGRNQRIDLKCSRNKAWFTSSLRIHLNGIVKNASWRYMFGQNFQLWLRNYCSYSKWTADISSHWSSFPRGTTGLTQYSHRRHLWTDQISVGVDTMKYRSLDNNLKGHEFGIQVYWTLFLSAYYNPVLHNYPVYNDFLLRKTLLDYRNNSNPARYQEITRF